jgi:hypothetical protein
MGRVIQALLEREVLDKEDFEALLKGEELRDRPSDPPSGPSPEAVAVAVEERPSEKISPVPPVPEPA